MYPQLQTERFLLQAILPEDQGFIYEGLSHPQVITFYGVQYDSYAATAMQMSFYSELWQNGTGAWWKIVDRNTFEKVGAVGFNNYQPKHRKAEIGYWLLPIFWKQGIISEVLPAVIQYLQEEKEVHRIEALVEDGNDASCRVLEKAGFAYEGTLRDYEIKNGTYISLRMYSLLAD